MLIRVEVKQIMYGISIRKHLALAALVCVTLPNAPAASSTSPRRGHGSSMVGDPARPAHAQRWIETQLYFEERGADEWQRFLDEEVTSRFPLGFSVADLYGQWRSPGKKLTNRAHSKMIIIVHPATAAARQKVAEIRSAWKKLTNDFSVLEVDQVVEVSW